MRIIGQFRDLGDSNRFVWLRGFADMPSREKALTSFYMHGDAWRQHAAAARSAMIDTTDALLLRPARAGSGFSLPSADLRPALDSAAPENVIVAAIHSLPAPASDDFLDFCLRDVEPLLKDAGAEILASFVTEHSPNNFPRLELREGENIFVLFLGFRDLAAHHAYMTALGQNPHWRNDVYPALLRRIHGRPQYLRLSPTSRSQLRC